MNLGNGVTVFLESRQAYECLFFLFHFFFTRIKDYLKIDWLSKLVTNDYIIIFKKAMLVVLLLRDVVLIVLFFYNYKWL